jgi:hypothetical protein
MTTIISLGEMGSFCFGSGHHAQAHGARTRVHANFRKIAAVSPAGRLRKMLLHHCFRRHSKRGGRHSRNQERAGA